MNNVFLRIKIMDIKTSNRISNLPMRYIFLLAICLLIIIFIILFQPSAKVIVGMHWKDAAKIINKIYVRELAIQTQYAFPSENGKVVIPNPRLKAFIRIDNTCIAFFILPPKNNRILLDLDTLTPQTQYVLPEDDFEVSEVLIGPRFGGYWGKFGKPAVFTDRIDLKYFTIASMICFVLFSVIILAAIIILFKNCKSCSSPASCA